MLSSLFRSALPDEAIEYAGFVLMHCAAIADANREGELICPFAVVTDSTGRRVLDFESDTQEEAVAKGWASLAEAKSSKFSWAFGREGIFREPDGTGTDVLTVTVWIPGMKQHYSFTQLFGRGPDQGIYLIGRTRGLKHGEKDVEPVERWNKAPLVRGIASHPQGNRWSQWQKQ